MDDDWDEEFWRPPPSKHFTIDEFVDGVMKARAWTWTQVLTLALLLSLVFGAMLYFTIAAMENQKEVTPPTTTEYCNN